MLTVFSVFAQCMQGIAMLLFMVIMYYSMFKFFFRRDLATFSTNMRKVSANLRKMFHKTKTTRKLAERNRKLQEEVSLLKHSNENLEKEKVELHRQLAKVQIGSLSLPDDEGGSLSYTEQSGALSESPIQKIKKELA